MHKNESTQWELRCDEVDDNS